MMSQTADALKRIVPEKFEGLASAVLRRANSTYRGLINTGVNTEGRTVNSPMDGICLIPGSHPPHFVIFHYTVDKRLGKKWLHEQTPSGKGSRTSPGDVIKAIRWTSKQREEFPATQVALVLACNTIPDVKSIAKAKQLCAKSDMDLDIWDFSRLLDFLEIDPDGQWLRSEHLGLAQKRLSIDLLRRLSLRSCDLYAKHEGLNDATAWVNRALDKDLSERIWRSDRIVTLLIAESGTGKTTASYRLLRKHLDEEGCGLWIGPNLLTGALTVEGVIEAALLLLCPSLEPGSGARALELTTTSRGFLLLVDDVSRSLSPANFVQKVASWDQEFNSGASEVRYRILCPVWPQVLLPLRDRFRESMEPLCLMAEGFSPEEGAAALERRAYRLGRLVTWVEAEDLADELGNDPLLIALWGEEQDQLATKLSTPVAFSVIDKFVQLHVSSLSVSERRPADEYLETLLDLARKMLLERRLVPHWNEIESWFRGDPDRMSALRQLLEDRVICRLGEAVSPAPLLFRHDRVRDHLLARSLQRWIDDRTAPDSLIYEPHYAEIVGLALTIVDLDPLWVERLAEKNPLALACALRFFHFPETPFQEAIVAGLRKWILTFGERAIPSLCLAVQDELARTDSPLVVELAGYFRQGSWGLEEARFRNGDAEAGARLANLERLAYFGWLGPIARHVADRFGQSFITKLSAILIRPNPSEEPLAGALSLAGYLAKPSLLPAIEDRWARGGIGLSPNLLVLFIWAATRCSNENLAPNLPSMLEGLGNLSDEKQEAYGSWSVRDFAADKLSRAFAESPPSETVIRFLCSLGKSERLWSSIFTIMAEMNHPDAVEFVVRSAADKDRGAHAAGKGSFYWSITHPWDERLFGRRRLRQECLDRLRSLWESKDSDLHLKRHAFSLWMTGSHKEDIPALQQLIPSSPLYRAAVSMRKYLGDRTAAVDVIRCLAIEDFPEHCWFDCHRIWGKDLKAALDSYLAGLADSLRNWEFRGLHPVSAELLRAIPQADGHQLLLKHWSHLGRSAGFVHSALSIATPECLAAATGSINECPEPKRLLAHVDQHLGIRVRGLDTRVSMRHLEALRPYLGFLSEHTIRTLWEFCNRRRFLSWRCKNLDSRLSSKLREKLGLDDIALLSELDGYAEWDLDWASMDYWLERFDERGDPPSRWKQILTVWLRDKESLKALEIASHCLVLRGKRTDLSLLEASRITSNDPRLTELIENTRFALFRRTLE